MAEIFTIFVSNQPVIDSRVDFVHCFNGSSQPTISNFFNVVHENFVH